MGHESEYDRQVEFHRGTDAGRFRNRMGNQVIARKEIALARRVLRHMPERGGALLEVGAGEGSNLAFMALERPEIAYVGVDFSHAKTKFQLAQTGWPAVCADATELPFASASFDVVLCRDLLHHVNWARDRVVAEALRVVRPAGRVVVMESDGRAPLNLVFRALYPIERGMRDSTPATLAALGRRHGPFTLTPIEATFLLRAVAFVLGAPRGFIKAPLILLFNVLAALDAGWARLLPPRRWSYWELVIEREIDRIEG